MSRLSDADLTRAALSDPDALPLDARRLRAMRRVASVKLLRHRLGMTQARFAESFQVPIATLRDWEQHRSTPDAPARALLLAIERNPKVMIKLLGRRHAA